MKALICGAGIAGLSLAQRLVAIGWNVTVIERSSGPRDHGYMIDYWGRVMMPRRSWGSSRGCGN